MTRPDHPTAADQIPADVPGRSVFRTEAAGNGNIGKLHLDPRCAAFKRSENDPQKLDGLTIPASFTDWCGRCSADAGGDQ